MQKIVNIKKMTLAGFSQRGSHIITLNLFLFLIIYPLKNDQI